MIGGNFVVGWPGLYEAAPGSGKEMIGRIRRSSASMPLRINRRKQGDITVLQVDGWLEGEEVQEFVRVAWSAPPPLALDLKDVRSADRRGIEAIRSLATDGVELWNVSPFIRLLLELPESEKNP